MKSFGRLILYFFIGLILFVILDAMLGGTGFVVLGGICLAIYLIPTIVAFARKVPSSLAIAVLNIFLGWSIIGFIVALVWSLKKYDYVPVGANQKEDKRTCDKILLEYDRYINEKDFIGWPLSNRIGGFHVEEKTLRYTPEPYPNYITELLVSNLDVHPNGKGQEKIAEFLYDRLG